MNYLYTPKEILNLLTANESCEILRKYNITSLCAFGSLINGDFTEISDVDLAIVCGDNINLDSILDLELFFEGLLNRPIDILDLGSPSLDLLVKINILNTCKILFSSDNNNNFNIIYNDTDRIYRENENFIYFRKVDVLS